MLDLLAFDQKAKMGIKKLIPGETAAVRGWSCSGGLGERPVPQNHVPLLPTGHEFIEPTNTH